MAKQHNQKFKEDADNTHKDLGVKGCATNLGIGYSNLQKWLKQFKETGLLPTCESGNYASDEHAEIARLKRELRDTKDALDILKKLLAFWRNDICNLSGGQSTDRSC
jgi:transposase